VVDPLAVLVDRIAEAGRAQDGGAGRAQMGDEGGAPRRGPRATRPDRLFGLVVIEERAAPAARAGGATPGGRAPRGGPRAAGLPGGQVMLPGGSHCSPGSMIPLPQDG